MKRARWLACTAFALCAGFSGAAVAQDASLPSVKEIVAEYDQALGGREAILRHTSSTMRGRMDVHQGDGVETLYVVYFTRAPYQRYERVSLPDRAGDILNGFDGETAWDFDPRRKAGAELRTYSGDVRESAKRNADFYYPLNELSWFKSMETAGIEDFEGHPCYRLRGVNNWNERNDHFYDWQTHLLAGYEFGSALGVTREIFFDYKNVDGVLVPMKQTVKAKAKDGGWNIVYVLAFDSVKFNDVGPAIFKLPPAVRDMVKKQRASETP